MSNISAQAQNNLSVVIETFLSSDFPSPQGFELREFLKTDMTPNDYSCYINNLQHSLVGECTIVTKESLLEAYHAGYYNLLMVKDELVCQKSLNYYLLMKTITNFLSQ